MTNEKITVLNKLNRRWERLQEEFTLNAPQIVIKNELILIKDAIDNLLSIIETDIQN